MNFLRKTFGFNEENNGKQPAPTPTPTPPQQNDGMQRNDDDTKPPDHQPEEGSVGATLWSVLSSKIGGDVLVAGISLPSWLYEPLSIIQRGAEMIEYGDVLTAAAACDDPIERLAYIAGFTVSGYSATQRYKPDFNPILGETFEYVDRRNNTKFFAEQVSHHPPISALHAINGDNWVFWQNSSPTTKFLGNCIDIDTRGRSHILFPLKGEHYFYTNPQCTRIHNIILGSMWIEHFGPLQIKNLDGSTQCTVNFKKSGIFQGTQYKVEGYISDGNGKNLVKLEGHWNGSLEGKWLVDTKYKKKGETRKLWAIAHDTFLHDQYNFTQFTASLNRVEKGEDIIILPSDSRRRLDRKNLEVGDSDAASYWKKVIEDRQRADRKSRKEPWQPVWFKKIELEDVQGEGTAMYVYCGDFWERRAQKEQALINGELDPVQLTLPQIRGLACDFTSYVKKTEEIEGINPTATTDDPTVTTDNPVVPAESDNANDAETNTENTTDTATDPCQQQTTTNPNGQDDTDTETELEGWNPDNSGTPSTLLPVKENSGQTVLSTTSESSVPSKNLEVLV